MERPAAGFLTVTLLLAVGLLAHAAGAGTGLARQPDPMTLLGSPFDGTGCETSAQTIGRGVEMCCPDFTAVVVDGTVRVVSIYGDARRDGGAPYAGDLPEGLEWDATLDDVAAVLGQPRRITAMYGPPTLVYVFSDRPYGSLELQFDASGELVRINASMTR